MTDIEIGVVDVYPIDPTQGIRVLLLRRAHGTRCTGAWEVVHGRIEGSERPEDAARREILEETGVPLQRLYNVTCAPFYLHRLGVVQLSVVFAAVLDADQPVRLSAEHDASEWLPLAAAIERVSWPRSRQILREIEQLFRGSDTGPLEDVLRVL